MNTATEIDFATFMEQAKALPAQSQWELVDELLGLLRGAQGKAKGKSKGKAKDPDAPKKPANEAILFSSQFIGPLFKALALKESDEGLKKELSSAAYKSKMAGILWADLKPLGPEEREAAKAKLTEEVVHKAFLEWRRSPAHDEWVAGKGDKKVAEKPAEKPVVAAAEKPAEEKPAEEKPKKVVSEETKAKAKATREAKKAAKAAESAAESASDSEASVKPKKAATKKAKEPEVKEPEPTEEQTTFVFQGKSYIRVMNYLWDEEGTWVGLYDPKTKKIDHKAEEPEAEISE